MLSLYNSVANDVTSTIKQYGQSVKIITTSGNISTYGVWSKSEAKNHGDNTVGNITITTNTIFVPKTTKNISVGDSIIVDKVTYTISKVNVYKPATTVLAYKLEVQV